MTSPSCAQLRPMPAPCGAREVADHSNRPANTQISGEAPSLAPCLVRCICLFDGPFFMRVTSARECAREVCNGITEDQKRQCKRADPEDWRDSLAAAPNSASAAADNRGKIGLRSTASAAHMQDTCSARRRCSVAPNALGLGESREPGQASDAVRPRCLPSKRRRSGNNGLWR